MSFCHNLSFWVVSKLEFLSFLTTWVLSQFEFWVVTFSVLKFVHNMSFWVVTSEFEFEFCPKLSVWVLSQFYLLVLSLIEFLFSFFTIWECTIWYFRFVKFQFCVFSQFECWSFLKIWDWSQFELKVLVNNILFRKKIS